MKKQRMILEIEKKTLREDIGELDSLKEMLEQRKKDTNTGFSELAESNKELRSLKSGDLHRERSLMLSKQSGRSKILGPKVDSGHVGWPVATALMRISCLRPATMMANAGLTRALFLILVKKGLAQNAAFSWAIFGQILWAGCGLFLTSRWTCSTDAPACGQPSAKILMMKIRPGRSQSVYGTA